jgi:hypothetical protein
MKKKKSKPSKPKSRYQSNPYALQPRNASGGQPSGQLVPMIVQAQPRRRRVARTLARTRQRVEQRATSSEFLAETGIAAGSAAVAALATGWMAGKGWSPLAVGAATAVLGGMGAVALPGVWKGLGIGVTSWGVGQLAASAMQSHAEKELLTQKKALEEQRAIDQAARQVAASEQKQLSSPVKPSNAFMPAISDAFASSRSYGRYGRADDEERMTDLDEVLG